MATDEQEQIEQLDGPPSKRVAAVCELSELLAYQNQDVLDAFCAQLDLPMNEAENIFTELMKFLWLGPKTGDRALGTIDQPILIIDEMWHTFVLFTKPYAEFCRRYFGRFIHHFPTTETERKRALEERGPEKRARVVKEQRERYTRIYDTLGRETFIRWFHTYPEVYPPERIKALRRK